MNIIKFKQHGIRCKHSSAYYFAKWTQIHGTKHDRQASGASSMQIYKPTINVLHCTPLN